MFNEIESSGGVPGDWVEIFNPSPAPANVGGFVFKDNDDTHSYALPAGTIVPAGGYLVSEVQKRMREHPGIRDARVEIVWEPKWDPKTMASEEAKEQLGIW